MNRGFFPKLAADNIRKNGKVYFPYIVTCVVTVAIFYIVKSLSLNPGLERMVGDRTLIFTMFLGSVIAGLFAFIFLFYTNSFLIKRRKKEFGVFNILGMEKRHLARTLAWENLYVTLIALGGGLVLGIALDKIMYLVIGKILGAEVPLGFFLSPVAVLSTVALFAVIFFLIFLRAVSQIHLSNPIELLRDGSAGEREPKTRWLMAAAGAVCVGYGYYLAITVKNPLTSVFIFFGAVVLVIIGTYLLFTAGSITLLKLLRRNKKYYYQTRHFTSVSGMIYRMKQNAVGLANICILSTMVLVMISSTSSMMLGMEDILKTRYPYDFVVYSDEEDTAAADELFDAVRDLQEQEQLPVTEECCYSYLPFAAVRQGDTFLVDSQTSGSLTEIMDSINNLIFVTLDDYNAVMGTDETLGEDEILLYANRDPYEEPVLKIFDREYRIKRHLDTFLGNGIIAANAASSQFIVVRDSAQIEEMEQKQREALGDIANGMRHFYGFDTSAGEEEQKAFYQTMTALVESRGLSAPATLESRAEARTSFMGMYGGFFFIGIFLGALFIMATVLIIYYKQISEGYEDRERFVIMQKVGMSRQEVKEAIRSQVLTVFFLPLIAAGIHVAAAFPLIKSILEVMNLSNTGLYVVCTVVCFLVFAAMYVLIYLLTARTYYRIVRR